MGIVFFELAVEVSVCAVTIASGVEYAVLKASAKVLALKTESCWEGTSDVPIDGKTGTVTTIVVAYGGRGSPFESVEYRVVYV